MGRCARCGAGHGAEQIRPGCGLAVPGHQRCNADPLLHTGLGSLSLAETASRSLILICAESAPASYCLNVARARLSHQPGEQVRVDIAAGEYSDRDFVS